MNYMVTNNLYKVTNKSDNKKNKNMRMMLKVLQVKLISKKLKILLLSQKIT